jgi:hypothetical protein
MKLSKSYSLKKSKSDEIISFTYIIIDIRNQKMTPWLDESATPRLVESATPQLSESATPLLGELGSLEIGNWNWKIENWKT